MSEHQAGGYYVPEPSGWPIVGSTALALLASGLVMWANHIAIGTWIMLAGLLVLFYMMFGWFGTVIAESQAGKYNAQVDLSYRWGMSWFIFSEVMFFAAFFGALFYMRVLSVPWLGEGDTNAVLWEGFKATWPSTGPLGQAIIAPMSEAGPGQMSPMAALGVPAINTLILLTSGVTLTIAHWGLKKGNRGQLNLWLALTVALGVAFLYFQVIEYHEAYTVLGLTMGSGAYGATFFMLTGFHGFHVTIGTIMLAVMLVRCLKGHFKPDNHFAFEAVSWYWHFVDVVWLGLFVFVYWL